MKQRRAYVPCGVIPAALTVFRDDFSIDMRATRKHFRFLGNVPGVTAVTVRGHAAEVHLRRDFATKTGDFLTGPQAGQEITRSRRQKGQEVRVKLAPR